MEVFRPQDLKEHQLRPQDRRGKLADGFDRPQGPGASMSYQNEAFEEKTRL